MLLSDPFTIHFLIPATDSLGLDNVSGKLDFQDEKIFLYYQLQDRAFKKFEPTTIEFCYSDVEEVRIEKKWFRRSLILVLKDPALIQGVPGVDVGKLTMEVEKRSKNDLEKLSKIVDFKSSQFALQQSEERMRQLREED